jgi:hypothetical protein
MFVELTCGRCEAHMQVDSEDDTGVWMLTWRFSEAHVGCGFIVPKAKTDVTVYRDTRIPPGDTG